MTQPYFSVVIPVLNELQTLPELHARLSAVLTAMGRPYEVLYIDDGSSDGTTPYLFELSRRDPTVRVLSFTRNFGQQAASMAGFAHARGEIVLTLDADLQNPPEAFPKLFEALQSSNADLVTGWRSSRDDSTLRTLPSLFFNALTSWVTGVNLKDYGSNLRVYRSAVTRRLADLGESSVHLSALVSWLGYRVVEVPVEHMPRKVGKSRYNFFKLYRATLDMVTSYSTLPIHLMSFVGFCFALLGMLVGGRILLIRLLYGPHQAGMQTVVALIFFGLGIQLISLGFMGEYLARMFVLLKKHPYYIIKRDSAEERSPTGATE